jgi:hypothetical protein
VTGTWRGQLELVGVANLREFGECSGMLIPAERLIVVNAAEAMSGDAQLRRRHPECLLPRRRRALAPEQLGQRNPALFRSDIPRALGRILAFRLAGAENPSANGLKPFSRKGNRALAGYGISGLARERSWDTRPRVTPILRTVFDKLSEVVGHAHAIRSRACWSSSRDSRSTYFSAASSFAIDGVASTRLRHGVEDARPSGS